MQTQSGPSRPTGYWWIAVLALLWNLVGLAMFAMQLTMDEARLAALPEADRQIYLATPAWLFVPFAAGVIGGVLGAIGLLLRRRWAVSMFAVSLLGVVVQFAGAYALTPAWQAYGAAGLAMPALVLVVALASWVYAARCRARGWLR